MSHIWIINLHIWLVTPGIGSLDDVNSLFELVHKLFIATSAYVQHDLLTAQSFNLIRLNSRYIFAFLNTANEFVHKECGWPPVI